MKNSNVKIYDTTLRDGTQGEGISFSVTDKLLIALLMGIAFGIGWTPCVGPILASVISLAILADRAASGLPVTLTLMMGIFFFSLV